MVRSSNTAPRGIKRGANEPATSANKRPKNQLSGEGGRKTPAEDELASRLLGDIRALGGDERDLDLVVPSSSDSGSEQLGGSSPINNNTLRRDVALFAVELGLGGQATSLGMQKTLIEMSQPHLAQPGSSERVGQHRIPHKLSIEASRDGGKPKQHKTGFIFAPRADWHAASVAELPPLHTGLRAEHSEAIRSLKHYAQTLLVQDAGRYRTATSSSSSRKFLSTIIASGTLQDKVSALTLAIQESPVHNIKAFESLLMLASKRSRTQAAGALGALVDLLGPGSLLPPSRRLKSFAGQPTLQAALHSASAFEWREGQALPPPLTKADLVYWMYEDWLKETYFKFILLLEGWGSDEIEYSRIKGIDLAYCLLKEKPEQEANLLRLLVDKLGDRERRVSSRASYLLLQLQVSHPRMKQIVVDAIDKELLLDPGRDARSRYYAINTLNQTILSSKDSNLIKRLLDIYFGLFALLLNGGQLLEGQKTSRASGPGLLAPPPRLPRRQAAAVLPRLNARDAEGVDKLVSAILTGVNRAIPFASAADYELHLHADTLFRLSHAPNFNTSVQALLLIHKLCDIIPTVADRFYRTLYESLLDPRLADSSKQALYLNLLLRGVKSDHDERRVKAFTKRMLQITSLHNVPFACGILYVISQARQAFPNLNSMIQQPEEDHPSAETPIAASRFHGYDGRQRNPEYSNAYQSSLWELEPLHAHFHPAIASAVSRVSSGFDLVEKPDLERHTLMRFLDKFTFKTPKTSKISYGSSIMQPYHVLPDQRGDSWLSAKSHSDPPTINTPAFWGQDQADVAAEDVFFHRYFSQIPGQRRGGAAPPTATYDTASEGDEDEILKALVSPEIDNDADVSDRSDFEELEEYLGALSDSNSSDSGMDDDGMSHAAATALIPGEDVDSIEDLFGSPVSPVAGAVQADASNGGGAKLGLQRAWKDRRQVLKSLPTFAAADDYEALLTGEGDL